VVVLGEVLCATNGQFIGPLGKKGNIPVLNQKPRHVGHVLCLMTWRGGEVEIYLHVFFNPRTRWR